VLAAILVDLLRLVLLPVRLLVRAFFPRGAYLTLDVDGRIVDLPGLAGPRPPRWLRRTPGPAALSSLRELARHAARDPRVAGLLVRVKALHGGAATHVSLRDALAELRAAGKDVVLHLPEGAGSDALLLASAARLVVVGPGTVVSPLGYAAEARYVRRTLERAGVAAEVFARGAYKSAGEALVRDRMSEAQREQLEALLDARHEALVSALSAGRGVPRATALRWIDEAPYPARDALERKLVDAIAYDDELPRLLSPGRPRGAPLLAARRYLAARRATSFRPLVSPGVVGVVAVHGAIVLRAPFAFGAVAVEERVVAALRLARAARSVRGVVLHVDSPGGSAVASDRIHHEVARLAEVKPVVAYLSDVAASGGYYVACGAHAIVAQPLTVTGSIGVVSARLVLGPLLERLGVATEIVRRGAHADFLSAERPATDEERAALERQLDVFYETFLGVVAKGRGRSVAEIEPLAGGRIWAGSDAHARGLVDALGGFQCALDEVRRRVGRGGARLEPRVVHPPRSVPPPPPLPPGASALVDAARLGRALELAQVVLGAGGDALAYDVEHGAF
jgi:protease-4